MGGLAEERIRMYVFGANTAGNVRNLLSKCTQILAGILLYEGVEIWDDPTLINGCSSLIRSALAIIKRKKHTEVLNNMHSK